MRSKHATSVLCGPTSKFIHPHDQKKTNLGLHVGAEVLEGRGFAEAAKFPELNVARKSVIAAALDVDGDQVDAELSLIEQLIFYLKNLTHFTAIGLQHCFYVKLAMKY